MLNNSIISLLSAFGITHFIKEADFLSSIRAYLIRLSPVFYKLLSCYFCLGFWIGLLVYLTQFNNYVFYNHILYGFASATTCFTISSIIFIFQNHTKF